MTGTSLDGLDVAAVRTFGTGELRRVEVLRVASFGLGECAAGLRRLADGERCSASEIAELGWALGERHGECLAGYIDGLDDSPDLIAVHGQTVFHGETNAGRHRTWQLLEPAPIARACGVPVLSNLRVADVAARGQGAPITPLADTLLFADMERPAAVVNLGGFCNATLLHEHSTIEGFDICACNHVLDASARAGLKQPFDSEGLQAVHGRAHDVAVNELVAVLGAQVEQRRSLGTGDEAAAWIGKWATDLSGRDLCASAAVAVAEVIRETVCTRLPNPTRVLLAGGGTRNQRLVSEIESRFAQGVVGLSDAFGVPIEGREAAAMGVLGALSMLGEPVTLPAVTGCHLTASGNGPIAGDWTLPPSGGWRMMRHD